MRASPGTARTLPDGRFRTTGSALFLEGGVGIVGAARFDPALGEFSLQDLASSRGLDQVGFGGRGVLEADGGKGGVDFSGSGALRFPGAGS